jgi:hypothetical protein
MTDSLDYQCLAGCRYSPHRATQQSTRPVTYGCTLQLYAMISPTVHEERRALCHPVHFILSYTAPVRCPATCMLHAPVPDLGDCSTPLPSPVIFDPTHIGAGVEWMLQAGGPIRGFVAAGCASALRNKQATEKVLAAFGHPTSRGNDEANSTPTTTLIKYFMTLFTT